MNAWTLLDHWGYEALGYLLAVLWQSSLLLAAVAVVTALLRNHPPALRQGLWLAALLAAPLLPLLSSLIASSGAPQAHVAVMPAYEAPAAAALLPAAAEDPEMPAAEPVSAAPPPATGPFDSPWGLGLIVYGVGALGFLTWTIAGHLRIRGWVNAAAPEMNRAVVQAFSAAAERFGIGRMIRVVRSRHVPAPISAGLLRPTVILPREMPAGLSEREMWSVAVHETAHIARHDPLVFSAVALVRAVLFFHPLAWLASRQVALLAEHAADDAVLEATGEALPYARLLTSLAESVPIRTPSAEGAAGIVLSKSVFLRRVEAVLSDRSRLRRLTRAALAATVAAAMITFGLVLAVPLTQQPVSAADSIAASAARVEGYTATFSNGATIELLGLAEHRSDDGPRQFWAPDGTPIAEPLYDDISSSVSGDNALEICLRTRNLPRRTGWSFRETQSSSSGFPIKDGRQDQSLRYLAATFSRKPSSLRVGLAMGPWKTESEMAKPQHGWPKGTGSSGVNNIVMNDPVSIGDQSQVTCSFPSYGRESRIVAVDEEWNEETFADCSTAGGEDFMQMTCRFNVPLDKVAAFRFQTRPYEWVTFTNIATEPNSNAPTDVAAADVSPRDVPAETVAEWKTKLDAFDAEMREMSADSYRDKKRYFSVLDEYEESDAFKRFAYAAFRAALDAKLSEQGDAVDPIRSWRIHDALAEIALKQGERQAALEAYKKAIETYPAVEYSNARQVSFMQHLHNAAAMIIAEDESPQDAEEWFFQCFAEDPRFEYMFPGPWEQLYRGDEAMIEWRRRAIEAYTAKAKRFPDQAGTLLANRASLQQELTVAAGDWGAAIDQGIASLRGVGPDNYRDKKDLQHILDAYESAANGSPDYAAFEALVQEKLEQYGDADEIAAWRLYYLLKETAKRAGNDEWREYLMEAIRTYPAVEYADPSRYSKLQHLWNELGLDIAERDRIEEAEEGFIEAFRKDERWVYPFLQPWEQYYAEHGLQARWPQFKARVEEVMQQKEAAATASADGEYSWGEATDGVRIGIKPMHGENPLGEPVWFQARIENRSENPVVGYVPRGAVSGATVLWQGGGVEIADASGAKLTPKVGELGFGGTGGNPAIMTPGFQEFRVEPGKTEDLAFDAAKDFTLSAGGKYAMKLLLHIMTPNTKPNEPLAVTSGEAAFTVVPAA